MMLSALRSTADRFTDRLTVTGLRLTAEFLPTFTLSLFDNGATLTEVRLEFEPDLTAADP